MNKQTNSIEEDYASAYPLDIQLATERKLRRFHQTRADAAEQRRIPPERSEYEALQKQLKQAQQTIQSLRQHIEVWKSVSAQMSARVDEVKDGTDTARLERERDFWHERWRAGTQTIARLMEHTGNCELLERNLALLEQQNATLRKSLDKTGV